MLSAGEQHSSWYKREEFMKVLYIVPYVPNLISVRPYNLIRYLSERGHDVTVFTLWTTPQEKADVEKLRSLCYDVKAYQMPRLRSLTNMVKALPSDVPLQSVYSWRPDLVADFNGSSEQQFDVIHVEHLRGAQYALHLKKKTNLPVVWDSVDCITHLFRQTVAGSKHWLGRWRSRLDLNRTSRYEGWLLQQVDHTLVTSEVDRQALLDLADLREAGDDRVAVLPNGVDLDYFKPDPDQSRDPATIVVSGKMSYHANVTMVLHLANNIMPLVWAERPDARLLIVGKDPVREVRALAENTAVTVTGTVPHLPPYLRRATVAVAPLVYGAGIQNKILEAMACAAPVVTTPQTIASLSLQPGRDLLLGHQPAEFAAQVLYLLNNPEQRQQIGLAGRCYVERHHDWPCIAERLETIYCTVRQQQYRFFDSIVM
jgi:polysaccharide biosynthesis protein PslH